MAKRKLLDIIDRFYRYLSQHDQVYISELRKMDNPISSPTDRHLLELITDIQERPYIYIKHLNEGRNTVLKLSSHPRDPKKRFIQLPKVIKDIEEKRLKIQKKGEEKNLPAESRGISWYRDQQQILHADYQQFLESILRDLVAIRDEKVITGTD